MRRIITFLLSLLALYLFLSTVGCMTAIQHGNIIEMDQTVFGFNVAASTGTTEMPAVQFGLIRSRLLFIPTATNKVYAPEYSTSGDINNNGRTLLFGGQEASTSGESMLVTNKPTLNSAGENVLIKVPGYTNSIISVP